MVSLTYAEGTIRVDGDVSVPLPGVERDPRSESGRAPAYRYAQLRDALRPLATDVRDDVLDLADVSELHSSYDLREYQRDALEAWEDHDRRGVLELPTGSGKTVIAIGAIERLATPTLVVVPTIDLLNQWRGELEAEFDVPVGQLGGGEQRVEPITVATYDSAYLRADELGDRFGLLVFDEVHHLGGEGYRDIARLLAAPARMGLTATFERPDGAHETVAELIGDRVYALDVDDLAGDHLAEQVGYDFVCAVGALERRREPEAGRRGKQASDIAIPLAAEVVDLVEDDEAEPVADLPGAQIRRVVRRDGDCLDSLCPTTQATDRHVELRR